jgi:hypothetical protein
VKTDQQPRQTQSTRHGFHTTAPDGKYSPIYHYIRLRLSRFQLSKADEEASEEVEVRREDQDKINRFSRLHQRELALEEQLKAKNVRLIDLLAEIIR